MSTKTNNFGFTMPEQSDAADITAQNENWEFIDAHMIDKTPKLLTGSDDLNTIKENGWYCWSLADMPQNTPLNPGTGDTMNFNAMRVWHGKDKLCHQELVGLTDSAIIYGGSVLKRVITNSTVLPWEWVNPHMCPSTEYRTTERYMGEAVYVKLQSDGIIHKRTESGLDITPMIYGTEDLTAGTSTLKTGQLYFVYE